MALGLIPAAMTSFKEPEVVTKELAAASAIPMTEAAGHYYEDGVNIEVSMASAFSWWSCLAHLVIM
eukprot:1718247-Pyramimonas_sp.AAC.1